MEILDFLSFLSISFRSFYAMIHSFKGLLENVLSIENHALNIIF